MKQLNCPAQIDLAEFSRENLKPRSMYGLPNSVIYCKKCVISNQRPNSAIEYEHSPKSDKKTIHFDENGVCDACRFSQKKSSEIDWRGREKELKELCDRFRKSDGSYDCIVPGSGGKDSFFASHVLRHKYGMNPLTVTWAPHIYTDWGWNNFQSWIHAGHDNFLMTPNGKVHRLLTRLATELLLHPFQPFIFGQKSLAPKMALLFNIPLVFYGENEVEYGNPLEESNSSLRKESYYSTENKKDILLGGVSTEELISEFGVSPSDLNPYLPADKQQLIEKKVEVHYLGYYLKWHPQSCYYYAVEHGGFQASPERTPGTYSKYNSIDDKIDDFHYLTTGIKFGLGRASYDAAQEIRSGEIDRSEGVALVNRFDHEFPSRFAEEIYKYLSLSEKEFPIASRKFEEPIMDEKYFKALSNTFRSPHLWIFESDEWKLRHPISAE